jgi:HD-GYP domain-containing protein (c-di-GMP phosphodiesterase class II)
MRRHPVIGERILNEVPGFEVVANAVRHEHERWDGTGYPDGLKGEQIPVASRIVLACDAYHAMTSDRPYRDAMSEAQAREQLKMHSGTQFDPQVVSALLVAIDALSPSDARTERPGWRETVGEDFTSNLRSLHGKAASL